MKKILVLGAGVIGSAGVVLGLSSGIASADDGVVGQTYQKARATLSQQGFATTVATTVGDRRDWDQCIVTSATKAPAKDGFGNSASATMLVNLNCYAKYGTALWPGFSLASPEGRAMYEQDLAANKQKQAEEAAAAAQQQQDELAAAGAQQAGE